MFTGFEESSPNPILYNCHVFLRALSYPVAYYGARNAVLIATLSLSNPEDHLREMSR